MYDTAPNGYRQAINMAKIPHCSIHSTAAVDGSFVLCPDDSSSLAEPPLPFEIPDFAKSYCGSGTTYLIP